MTLIPQIEQLALTPGRQTAVTWDISEDLLVEDVFCLRREGHQIYPSTRSNVERLASGVWVLQPVNTPSALHEAKAVHAYTLRLTDFDASALVVETPRYRPLTELSGHGTAAAADTAGDYWFSKRVAAGATWNNPLASAGSPPTLPTAYVPLDRLMRAKSAHDPMTGYTLRIKLSGSLLSTSDSLLGFQFGEEIWGDATKPHLGFGKFEVVLLGNGKTLLFEWIDGAWTQVAAWQFQLPKASANAAIFLRILPHFPRFIEFSTAVDSWDTLIDLLAATARRALNAPDPERSAQGVYVHEIANRGSQAFAGVTGSLMPITGQGRIAVDVRRDKRFEWSLSRLQYPASGTLTDRPFVSPLYTTSHLLRASAIGYNYYSGTVAQTSLSTTLQTAAGVALTPSTESFAFNGVTYPAVPGFVHPGGEGACRNVVTLTNEEVDGSRWHTPSLMAVQVLRNGHRVTHSPGTKTGGNLQRVSITGPGVQPDHESGFLDIEDDLNQLTVLRTRGKVGVRVEVEWAPATPKAVIFEGYTGRVTATRKGKISDKYLYPSPEWRRYNCELVGKWDRLSGRFFTSRFPFSDSSWAPSGRIPGPNPCWYATDIIRFCLIACGFPESSLDIFHDDTQLFGKTGQAAEEIFCPAPGTPIADYLWMLCRDFLNASLSFDPSAGSAGMWRLKRPPTGTETPLWNFSTLAPTVTGPLIATFDGAYGANSSTVYPPFDTFIVPPEGNVLTVTGGANTIAGRGQGIVSRTLYNPLSWNLPGAATSDVNSLDYLGQIIRLEYVDTTITDQDAVDFIARRIFNLACRGRKFANFIAPLVFVAPSEPSIYTTRTKRPLRVGDMVTLDGDPWIVHSCDADYEADAQQTARYELEVFRAGNTFW